VLEAFVSEIYSKYRKEKGEMIIFPVEDGNKEKEK